MKKQQGFAALLIIFILGMVSILLASGLILTGYNESQMARTGASGVSAYYVADSGVEDAIYKLNAMPAFASSSNVAYTLPVGAGHTSVTVSPVSGNSKQRTVDSVGTMGTFVTRIHALVQNTSLTPGFLYAIQAGVNGIEIRNNSTIKATTGDGNVYSNGYIAGAKNDNQAGACKNSATAILGSAYAVTSFDKTEGNNDSGVCVLKDAYASAFNYCFVGGSRSLAATANCPGGTVFSPAVPAPTPIPLPDMDVAGLKTYLTNRGTTYSGDCTVNGTPSSCGGVTNTIGNMIITGNLTVPQNTTVTFTNPVWVKGTITFNQNVVIGLTGTVGKIIVTDQPMTVANNNTFTSVGNAHLLFLSTYTSYPSPSPTPTPGVTSPFCDTPAISIKSNTSNVLFYAPYGCVSVSNNAQFNGALLGEKIVISNTSTIAYNPDLATAVFTTSAHGGWQIASFRQD